MVEKLENFEFGLLYFVQENLRFEWLTPIMKFFSLIGDNGLVWIAFTVVLLILKRTRRIGAMCSISLIFDVLLVNCLLKNLFARVRPYDTFTELKLLVDIQHDWSFPSGHSAAAFATCIVLLKVAPKKLSIPSLVVAILIAFSRIYVCVHYPTDVIGGILIGIFCAEFAVWVYRKIENLYNKKHKII